MNIFKSFFKSRDKPKNASVGTSWFHVGRSWSGKAVTERTALQQTSVYACVRIIAETIASLPLHLYKYTDNGKEKDCTHPLYYLLHDEPNHEMTAFVFRETIVSHLLLWGNAYAQIIRNGKGEVIELYPLLPDKMEVYRSDITGEIYYIYTDTKGQRHTLNNTDILHIPGLGYDGLIGYSPIAMTKNAIGLSIAAEEYGARFFANSANPSGVLEHPGVLKDPRKLRESWNEVYGGTSNSHRVAVLEEGVTFKAISIPPNEAQFLETRKFQINEICRIFRVPPHMVADLEKSSFSNIEQQSLDFIVNTIRPWLVRIEQSICQKLLSVNEKGVYFVKFNVDGMLRGDFASRMNGYAIARQNGWMSTNDIREIEDMNKIPAELGGDRYLCNGNMVDLTNAGVWTQTGGKTENE